MIDPSFIRMRLLSAEMESEPIQYFVLSRCIQMEESKAIREAYKMDRILTG